MIFSKFQLNIRRYPTLSSLAFGIWRTHYIDLPNKEDKDKTINKLKIENAVHKLTGNIADHIRHGYTGGAVDMYIPTNPEGTLVYCYDVNSLYPYSMAN